METRCELGGLLLEAQITIEAAAMGCEVAIRKEIENKAKLGAILKLVSQAGDALEALHERLEPLLQGEEPDSLGDILDEIIEVAGFYADPDKYRPIGKRQPEILGDKGERAQGLLETIDSLGRDKGSEG